MKRAIEATLRVLAATWIVVGILAVIVVAAIIGGLLLVGLWLLERVAPELWRVR